MLTKSFVKWRGLLPVTGEAEDIRMPEQTDARILSSCEVLAHACNVERLALSIHLTTVQQNLLN